MKRKKKIILLQNCADILIELGKLAFAGFVIGGILSDAENRMSIIFAGSVGSFATIALGIFWKTKYANN